jgi:hypothetical protein
MESFYGSEFHSARRKHYVEFLPLCLSLIAHYAISFNYLKKFLNVLNPKIIFQSLDCFVIVEPVLLFWECFFV